MPDRDPEFRIRAKGTGPFRTPGAARSPRDALRAAVEGPFARGDGGPGLDLEPGLDDDGVAALVRAIGTKLPAEIDELVRFASGFASGELDGDTRLNARFDFGLEDLLPRFAPMCDSDGDSTGIYIRETGEWGPVLHCTHDPSVVIVEAPDLVTWFEQTLLPPVPAQPSEDDAHYREERGLLGIPVESLLTSEDLTLRAIAEAQPAGARIHDLRRGRRGDGFRLPLDDTLTASGTELVFVRAPGAPRLPFSARVRRFFRRT